MLGNEGQGAQRVLERGEEAGARPRLPGARLCRGRIAGDGPVAGEAAKVIEAQDVDQAERRAQTVDPPGVAGGGEDVPTVERVAPQLAGGAEVVGRHPCHERRPAVRRQVEQLAMRPAVGAVLRREDGRIADDADATLRSVLLERYPLPEEEVLHADVPADLALQPPALPGKRSRLPSGDLGLPR